jgi:metallo-beta-lactamase family protein
MRIIDGASRVRIFGEEIPVRASVHTIGGFSAHADQAELLQWHAAAGDPQRTFLVHGDPDAMETFAAKLTSTHIEMPALHQSYEL